MKINIKKLDPNAVIPKRMTVGAAGMDVVATSKSYDPDAAFIEFGTGLSFEIPEGYAAFLYPRSSITKTGYILGNSVGILDADFRGELKFRFKIAYGYGDLGGYEVGDRIGQIVVMPVPEIEFVEVEELEGTQRGSGGWGSSGC